MLSYTHDISVHCHTDNIDTVSSCSLIDKVYPKYHFVAADVETCSVLAKETQATPIPRRMPQPATSYQKSDFVLP